MATLGDLQSRIITETGRDDLADTLASSLNTAIASAIDYYAAERFWFNEATTTSTASIGSQYVPIPAGVRFLDVLRVVVGNVRYDLRPQEMEVIEALYSTPISGQPTDYAMFGANVRLWPTPNLAYTMIWLGVSDVTALDYTNTSSSNYWTVQGYDLITGRTKIILYRDFLSAVATDPRLQLAEQQERAAYERLKAETNRRISTGRIAKSW